MTLPPPTLPDYSAWSQQVRSLHRALVALRPAALAVGVPPPTGEEWFDLLERKLLPQLEAQPLLVVAVVGGTNIGKSVVFNHLAGETASRTSPLAAGTKHPVCLAPPGFADEQALSALFEGFQVCPWQSPDDPLTESAEHLLFWRVGRNTPPRLLVLDTPDIDSDAAVNWQRADHVRQSADVLLAVLTQQKYNDAAVKQFFRAGVEADKPVVVVFNQCDLEHDAEYWPIWLETFTAQTGARPELVYVVPRDRKAAEELRLPFYEVGPEGRRPLVAAATLRDELASLHFERIKIRTFRGALARVLDPASGAQGHLARVRRASGEFSAAAAALSASQLARVQWPALPARLLVEEIRDWWDASRSAWSRRIHGFYRTIGQGITWPVRSAYKALVPEQVDPLVAFQHQEREAIVLAVQMLLDELDRHAQVGNDILRPRLEKLLSGGSRRDLLARVEAGHAELPPVDDAYRDFLRSELDAWGKNNPKLLRWLGSLDQVAAVARPAITVSLALSGWMLVVHSAFSLAADAAIAVGVPAGGEAVVSVAGEGFTQAAATLFGRLQTRYAEDRVRWLAAWLERELLGELLSELRRGAETPHSPAFAEVQSTLALLSGALGGGE